VFSSFSCIKSIGWLQYWAEIYCPIFLIESKVMTLVFNQFKFDHSRLHPGRVRMSKVKKESPFRENQHEKRSKKKGRDTKFRPKSIIYTKSALRFKLVYLSNGRRFRLFVPLWMKVFLKRIAHSICSGWTSIWNKEVALCTANLDFLCWHNFHIPYAMGLSNIRDEKWFCDANT